jgi:transcriptional regulator with XRE-family HTH domain
MKLSEKLELLRRLEGSLRGFKRPLSKSEVSRLVAEEQGEKISVAFLSQLESGKRPHMTETTRELLARFYKVHPAFFVSDPEGYDSTITSVPMEEDRFDTWLLDGALQFSVTDPELAYALRSLAQHNASRAILLLMGEMMRDADLLDRMRSVVALSSTPGEPNNDSPKPASRSPKKKGAK